MKSVNTFSVLPLIRKARANKLGETPIYFRITVNKGVTEFSTKHYINPDLWDSKAGRVSGKTALAKATNKDLANLELSCRRLYNQLITSEKAVSASIIKDLLQGKQTNNQHTILALFNKMVQDIKALEGKDYSKSTVKHYKTSLKHLGNYVSSKYQAADINLKELDYEFITGFELYLKSSCACNQNGCLKHMQRLRKAITLALHHEYLEKDPFMRYSIKKKRSIVQPLNKYELQAIEKKEFGIERLNIIKDIFLFTCYTGLAFSDTALLAISVGPCQGFRSNSATLKDAAR
jgi:hypothetical protein